MHLRLVADAEAEALLGPAPAPSVRLTTYWQTYMLAEGLSARTVRERLQLLERVSRATGADPATWSHHELALFLARPMAAGTRMTYYTSLRAWHRWLAKHGHRDDDPTLLLAKPRVPRRQPKPVTTTHLQQVLDTRMRARTRALVLLCALQGLRISEACAVRGEDVDLDGGRLRVVGKGGVDALLPLHPVIAELAAAYPRRGWWFPARGTNREAPDGRGPILARSGSTLVSQVMARAGVPGTAHSLRHWHATAMLRGGADVRVVQTLLRHADLSTTAIYTEVDVDQQRAALAALPDVEPAGRAA